MNDQEHKLVDRSVNSQGEWFGFIPDQLMRLAAGFVVIMGLVLYFVPNDMLLAIAIVLLISLGCILVVGVAIWIAIGSKRLNFLIDSMSLPVTLLFYTVVFIGSGTLFYYLINSN